MATIIELDKKAKYAVVCAQPELIQGIKAVRMTMVQGSRIRVPAQIPASCIFPPGTRLWPELSASGYCRVYLPKSASFILAKQISGRNRLRDSTSSFVAPPLSPAPPPPKRQLVKLNWNFSRAFRCYSY